MAVTKKRSFDTWFGTSAEKSGFTSMALGDKYFETDTQLLFEYTGTEWVTSSIDNLTLSAGTNIIGKVGIDQVTPNANKVVTKTGSVTNATLQAGTNVVGKMGIDQTTDGTTNKVQARNSTHDDFNANANLQIADTDVDNANPVPVDLRSIQTGTNIIGQVGIDQTTDGTTNLVRTNGAVKTGYATTALAASGIIKASAGTLYGLAGINDSASDQYLQIFDSVTVPADTTVPDLVLFIPAKSNFSFDLGIYGYALATGISWSNSSTLATKTIGSDDVWLNGIYN